MYHCYELLSCIWHTPDSQRLSQNGVFGRNTLQVYECQRQTDEQRQACPGKLKLAILAWKNTDPALVLVSLGAGLARGWLLVDWYCEFARGHVRLCFHLLSVMFEFQPLFSLGLSRDPRMTDPRLWMRIDRPYSAVFLSPLSIGFTCTRHTAVWHSRKQLRSCLWPTTKSCNMRSLVPTKSTQLTDATVDVRKIKTLALGWGNGNNA